MSQSHYFEYGIADTRERQLKTHLLDQCFFVHGWHRTDECAENMEEIAAG